MFIRKFTQLDYPAVKEIYQQGIDTGNATFQLISKTWDEWHNSMHDHSRLVAEDNGHVCGWAALSPVSNRDVYSGIAEVSVYVSKAAQGKGIGHKLLAQLIVESEKNNIWTLQAAIFPENLASIQLHLNNNFRRLGIREKLGKMHDTWRDVVLLERRSQIIGIS
ncbi:MULTISPECIES: GNAT family N-acetyltransferase [Pseudoalteromonas]|uniref:N-acetyltransferase family protein n=1 Tax=Pseudoalteromonas haloplanktis TaxID=228 RepID=A0ABU1B8T4_PSEHA|nr:MULTISPECIES: GNAT family N-acetyltransferase [Pseudoalteromonas]MCF6142687.1 phosphinothricin acetyltransferase [Pseudoalteromonas mariniglutinosa NCIMB 1770]MDQ9090930.1 N-acetyltransferase family protein [Pseudoalteromonas haloplanktis]TMN69645.1 GNAT family N-acetyltransferase [Pseudoalteromonas sp. S1727]